MVTRYLRLPQRCFWRFLLIGSFVMWCCIAGFWASQYVPTKRRNVLTQRHGVTTLNTWILNYLHQHSKNQRDARFLFSLLLINGPYMFRASSARNMYRPLIHNKLSTKSASRWFTILIYYDARSTKQKLFTHWRLNVICYVN
jgi:hypothetical protein